MISIEELARFLQDVGLSLILGSFVLRWGVSAPGGAVGNPTGGRDPSRLLLSLAAGIGSLLVLLGGYAALVGPARGLCGPTGTAPTIWAAMVLLVRATDLGKVVVLRAVMGLVTAGFVFWGRFRLIGAVGAAVLALAFALGSHAQTGATPWLSVPLQALHNAAAATWFGGLAVLVVASFALRDSHRELPRWLGFFSQVGLVTMVVLAATGSAVAVPRLFGLSDLVETAYGVQLVRKLLGVGAVLALAAFHRFLLLPAVRAGRAVRLLPLLRTTLVLEAAVGLWVVLSAATLASTPPSLLAEQNRSLGPPVRISVVAYDHRYEPVEVRVPVGRVVRVTLVNRGKEINDWTVSNVAFVGGIVSSVPGHHHAQGGIQLHMHALPGRSVTIEFIPVVPGRYQFVNTANPRMTGWMIVEPRAGSKP